MKDEMYAIAILIVFLILFGIFLGVTLWGGG